MRLACTRILAALACALAASTAIAVEITLTASVSSLERVGFNDRADAAIVRGGVWRLCEHARQQGNCQTFPPGRYNDLGSLGGKVSSVAIVPR
jgi:hypothetical protein